jgi:hypothetical protein
MFLNELHFDQLKQDRERELASRVCVPRQPVESSSIRRSVGRSIMQIGAWLAAEPQPRLARSR